MQSQNSKKLAVFDFDSTLMDGESINIVLNKLLKDPKQKHALEEIRAKGMSGEYDLQHSLSQRIAFFKGLKPNTLEQICQEFKWNTGAQHTILSLKKRGYITLCLSASFRTAARSVINELGMDAYASNTLEMKKGVFTGGITGDLMHHDSKGKLLNKIQNELEITPQNTIVVGDGANDLSLFLYANTKVAFCAQDALNKKATHIIKEKNLAEILNFI